METMDGLEIAGRKAVFDVLVENEGAQPLIGQIVLERLDLVIEPSTRKVIPNPRSPEMPMIEILATSHNSEDTATVPRKNWQGTFFYPYSVLREGVLITIGYILSPLSWWNDSFVNIPIAYLFGCLFTLISPKLFLPSMIIGYWITNVVGLCRTYSYTQRGFRCFIKNRREIYKKEIAKWFNYLNILYTAYRDISALGNSYNSRWY